VLWCMNMEGSVVDTFCLIYVCLSKPIFPSSLPCIASHRCISLEAQRAAEKLFNVSVFCTVTPLPRHLVFLIQDPSRRGNISRRIETSPRCEVNNAVLLLRVKVPYAKVHIFLVNV
jgi:hypothetical protein